MLILMGSFSLLAASTSCRRTAITASLCLVVSRVSQSDWAAGDLPDKDSRAVIKGARRQNEKGACGKDFFFPLLLLQHIKG